MACCNNGNSSCGCSSSTQNCSNNWGSCFTQCPVTFSFTKTDTLTGLPVANALFAIYRCNRLADLAASSALGVVSFSLPAGTYIMRELVPAPGYVSNPAVYTVVVSICGTVTIDGISSVDFILLNTPIAAAATPVPDVILAGAAIVSGTGTVGCTITITWPNGTSSQTVVGVSGTFALAVPSSVVLTAGQIVLFQQACANTTPSLAVPILVGPSI